MKKLGFGLMRLPLLDASDAKTIDIERVKGMVDEFMENGFTYFDTAAPYHSGMCEYTFKKAVAERYPRDAYTVTDKLSMFMIEKEEEIAPFFENNLKNLGVDYVDYYLLHGLKRDSYEKCVKMHAFEFVKRMKDEGKIKHIGFSFHGSAEMLDEVLTAHPEMEYVQLQINYIDWESENVQSRKCYEVAVKHNMPVIVMEPVKGGSLVNIPESADRIFKEAHPDWTTASWALRFAASHENVMVVLSGMSNEEQLRDNISFMKDFKPLTEAEMETVKKASQAILDYITIPCTNCRYCVDDCPKQIAIPDYFKIYNEYKQFNRLSELISRCKRVAEKNGAPSDCIKCGKCESLCPQHLTIRKYLETIAEEAKA